MSRTYRERVKYVLWCWRCGVEFEATRLDSHLCAAACRMAVSRDFSNGVFEALIYPFRWGPRLGRLSKVYEPENVRRVNAKRGRRWL